MIKRLALMCLLASAAPAFAGQAPDGAASPDIPISSHDRFYTSDQFSNTVSVIDPASNKLMGVIRLGDPTPLNLSPLYRGQLLVHGMGFSPDHRTLAVISIGSNSVTFIDTATNTIRHTSYVGRAPHEAFFTPDGREVWVAVRGQDYLQVLDGKTFEETGRISVPNGPGMTIFAPDGRYAYVCSSFTPETVVIDTHTRQIVGRVKQISPFCPDIAATPDGRQVWMTLKDTGKVMVFDARPPFAVLKVLDTGPITNHVNIVRNGAGQFAYVTVGAENLVKVFRTDDFSQATAIPVGSLPHGLWPSGDGSRIYVGLENGDAVAAIDTHTNTLIATIPIGQAPQGVAYVPDAVPTGDGMTGLVPLGVAGHSDRLILAGVGPGPKTQVTLFDQGQVQVLQAAAVSLKPMSPYVLALSNAPEGSGALQPLARFTTNAAGAAIVDAVGPLREVVSAETPAPRRYLVIAEGTSDGLGPVVQRQQP